MIKAKAGKPFFLKIPLVKIDIQNAKRLFKKLKKKKKTRQKIESLVATSYKESDLSEMAEKI